MTTSSPPTEIQALIDAHINGFKTQNNDLFPGVFGVNAIIIDGTAPYRWLNPNAPANWLSDVEIWRKDLGVSKALVLRDGLLECRGLVRICCHIRDYQYHD